MAGNLFKGIDKRSQKKTLQLTEEEVQKAVKNKVVTDVYNYVKIRIEMGIFEPLELTDVYSLDIYIGIQLPRDLDAMLNNEEICLKQDDYLVFDFNGNISYIKKDDFSSFYKFSKVSPYQQLLSAIQLFKIEASADEVFVKSHYNKNLRDSESEDAIFDKLAEMIMNGNVDEKYIDAYQAIMEEKYKNQLINYHILPEYQAKYLAKKLREKNLPFALLCPLVDSIVQTEEGDFDVDAVLAINNYIALILTIADGAVQVAACVAQMNKEIEEGKALIEMGHSVDTMSIDELIAFKAQLDASGICIPNVSPDKIMAQLQQEAIEEGQIHGNDVLAQDTEDLFR